MKYLWFEIDELKANRVVKGYGVDLGEKYYISREYSEIIEMINNYIVLKEGWARPCIDMLTEIKETISNDEKFERAATTSEGEFSLSFKGKTVKFDFCPEVVDAVENLIQEFILTGVDLGRTELF